MTKSILYQIGIENHSLLGTTFIKKKNTTSHGGCEDPEPQG